MAGRSKKTLPKSLQLDSHTQELAIAKLASSGLDEDDAKVLGVEFLTAARTASVHQSFKPVVSIKINYYDPLTREPLSPWPKWPAFYRIRYLEEPADFAALTEGKKIRYVNEPNAGVAAYFPMNIDWTEVFEDHERSLIITEGELKAAKASKHGFPTIGLGGVYNFRASKFGLTFLNELERLNWVKRKVYIIYDSDFRSNEQVCQALNALAEELMKRGALVYTTPLPDVVEGGKTGLDDFLLEHSADELLGLLIDRSMPLTISHTLWNLNEEVVYVRDPGLILVKPTGQKLTPSSFKDHAYATLDHAEQVVNKDGELSIRPVSAAASWLKWSCRHEVAALTYAPGAEQLINDGDFVRSRWNTWPGWGCEPMQGDVTPFLQLIDHLFINAEVKAKQWFLRWCAYPMQHPGTKLFTYVLLHGIKHGTGKSLIGYTLGRIYGKNFTEISQSDLHASFNEWSENKQLILGDDVTGSDKRQDNDLLKKLITQKEMRINAKYMPSYVIPDCINYLFTANHPDTVFLEDDDRRAFIHEIVVTPLDEEFYMNYMLWLETGGSEAVFDYLLKLDIGDFNPAAPALKTGAKERMIADVKSDLGAWVSKLVRDPDSILKIGDIQLPGDLFTNKQLLQLYDPDNHTRTTANGLGRELRRNGITYVCHGKAIKTSEGSERLYVLRNADKWMTVEDPKVVIAHLSEVHKPKVKKY